MCIHVNVEVLAVIILPQQGFLESVPNFSGEIDSEKVMEYILRDIFLKTPLQEWINSNR